jgi:serine phosphatase RsbU (regulator of sigma subunit)
MLSPRAVVGPVDPVPCQVPQLLGAEIAAVYYDLRRAGDFYEFMRVGRSRMVFALLDMAGRRADTRDILRAAQTTFRETVQKRFAADDFNEAIAMMELSQAINHTVLQAGIHACPGFLGCYNEQLGTVCYVNAGHPPALLCDLMWTAQLEATGLPLGLFSHLPQGASTCALEPGAVLLVVSRGIVEAEHAGNEFGIQGVSGILRHSLHLSARDLCFAVLRAAENFTEVPLTHNDVTALALVRHSQPCPA